VDVSSRSETSCLDRVTLSNACRGGSGWRSYGPRRKTREVQGE